MSRFPAIDPGEYGERIFLGYVWVSENGRGAYQPMYIERGTGTMREYGNLAVLGAPGASKGVFIRNNAELWRNSLVVVDLKGTLYANTAARRAEFGEVYVLDVRSGTGHRYNPVAMTPQDAWRDLAEELVAMTNDDPFWSSVSVDWWLTCWHAAQHAGRPHLPYLVEVTSLGVVGALQYLLSAHGSDPRTLENLTNFYGRQPSGELLSQFAEHGPSRLLESKWASVVSSVAPLKDPNMLNIFSGHDLDVPGMFYDSAIATVYVQADETKPKTFAIFARAVMKSLGDALIKEGDRDFWVDDQGVQHDIIRRPVLFFFDEFGVVRLNSALTWLDTMRSRDVVLCLLAQKFEHLAPRGESYDEYAENSYHHMFLFKPPDSSNKIAKKITALAGQQSIRVDSFGESVSSDSVGSSRHYQWRDVDVIPQAEIKRWPQNVGYAFLTAGRTVEGVCEVPRMFDEFYDSWPARSRVNPPAELSPYTVPLLADHLPTEAVPTAQQAQEAVTMLEAVEQAQEIDRLAALRRAAQAAKN